MAVDRLAVRNQAFCFKPACLTRLVGQAFFVSPTPLATSLLWQSTVTQANYIGPETG